MTEMSIKNVCNYASKIHKYIIIMWVYYYYLRIKVKILI